MTNSNHSEILAALNLVASFLDEDSQTFAKEMVARKSANLDAIFAAAGVEVSDDEATDVSAKLSLRTEEARTEFDARVFGILARRKGVEVSAATLIESYKQQRGFDPTTAQMRAALNRLIESGHVTYSGIQRGTKYAVA